MCVSYLIQTSGDNIRKDSGNGIFFIVISTCKTCTWCSWKALIKPPILIFNLVFPGWFGWQLTRIIWSCLIKIRATLMQLVWKTVFEIDCEIVLIMNERIVYFTRINFPCCEIWLTNYHQAILVLQNINTNSFANSIILAMK